MLSPGKRGADTTRSNGVSGGFAALSGICVRLLNGGPGWTADLSGLLFCSVLPFTAVEGKRNSLGKVFAYSPRGDCGVSLIGGQNQHTKHAVALPEATQLWAECRTALV